VLHALVLLSLGRIGFTTDEGRHAIEVELVMTEGVAVRGTFEATPSKRPRREAAERSMETRKPEVLDSDVATSAEDKSPSEKQMETVSQPLGNSADGTDALGAIAGEIGRGAVTAQERYLMDVRRLLEAKKEYPMAARRLGHQGRVIVRFVLGRDGRILEAKIVEASRSDILNRAARGLIENLGGLKPFPTEISLAEWAVIVPIEYKM
jgi:protein TonB